ncbi:MAG: hypothetical protein RIR86_3246 [Acidobacteriota bacterium]
MSGKRFLRLFLIVLVTATIWPSPPAGMQQKTGAGDHFRDKFVPFFRENCYSCHNEKKAAGGLNLEQYQEGAAILAHRDTWESVLQRMEAGEMPPKGAPRPDELELKALTAWLSGEFSRADERMTPDPGRVTARRLNRSEYNNTIRDLLGVDLRPADNFPQDDSGYGFDTIGDVLSLPPVLMEKYLTAAERVTEAAIFGPERLKPSLTRIPQTSRNIVPSKKPLTDYDRTGLSMVNALHVTHRFPVEADYLLRIFTAGERPLSSEPVTFALWVDGQQVQTLVFDAEGKASFEDDRQDFSSMTIEFRQHLTAGEHWIAVSILNFYDGLPAEYGGENPSHRPPPVKPPFRAPPRATPERVVELKKAYELRWSIKRPVNTARASRLEIGGPYDPVLKPSPESQRLIYACGHLNGRHVDGCEQKIIANLARRAWRRPVSLAETSRLRRLFTLSRQRGSSFEEGLAVALQAILVSPHFLFRIEDDRAAQGVRRPYHPLDQYELAARLSYFLWSSMPDAELRRLADRQMLRQPGVLEAQVKRMIADPKSRALVENFGGQWLELRRLESVTPDTQRFPAWDEYLRVSIRRETELLLQNILQQDRPLTELIDADYTYLNERLARFYEIPGVTGPAFQRVQLKDRSRRGGILTQASVLTVSSYATRTSPVLRGKWILENILNAPPPAPPAGVPPLSEEEAGKAMTLRQKLEEHRKNPTCASCHARMDPLGFGLENFDAIGRWRTHDGDAPIDSSGVLPNGTRFSGPGELKQIVLQQRDAFTQGLTEKMLTYALGRGVERYDRPVIRQIATKTAANNYRISSLITEIVRSLPFQNRGLNHGLDRGLDRGLNQVKSPEMAGDGVKNGERR